MIPAIMSGQGSLHRSFSWGPLPYIGRISYSLYLWHWPVIVFFREFAPIFGWSADKAGIVGALIGIALAIAAFYVIEQPLRSRRRDRRRPLAFIAAAFAASVACSLVLCWNPLPPTDPLQLFDTPRVSSESYQSGPRATHDPLKYREIDFATDTRMETETWRTGGLVHPYGGSPVRVVLIGDSQALALAPAIDEICRDLGVSIAYLARGGTSVFPMSAEYGGKDPTRDAYYAGRREWLQRYQPDVVLIVAKWDGCHPQDMFQRCFSSLLDETVRHARNVIVCTQVPTLGDLKNANIREFSTWYRRWTGRVPSFAPDNEEMFREKIVQIFEAAAETSDRLMIAPIHQAYYQPDRTVRWFGQRQAWYMDDHHLTDAGARAAIPMLKAAIALGLQKAEVPRRHATLPGQGDPRHAET